MKKIILFSTLLFISLKTVAQVETGSILRYHFFKVDKAVMPEYETVMKDWFQKVQQARVDNGCIKAWVFRKIVPGSSNHSSEYTHMAIDVYMPGEERPDRSKCDIDYAKLFPDLSEGMIELLQKVMNNKERMYNARLKYVSGGGDLQPYAIYNLTKTKNRSKYINKHKEYSEIFTKYSDRGAWHAIERIDPEGYAQWNWDYVTVDAYPSASVARKNVNKVPKKIRNKMLEKYGTGPEQRTIRERFVGLLLAKAN